MSVVGYAVLWQRLRVVKKNGGEVKYFLSFCVLTDRAAQ